MKVTLYFTSTRLYNCHHCKIETNSGIVVEGKCKYQNRTWESYDYETAIMNAVHNLEKVMPLDPHKVADIRHAQWAEQAIERIEALGV